MRANLHTARLNDAGKHQLVPDLLIFRGASKRSMDWHLIFVVDVSGSMEPSVIYSAMMAAILSGLPAISVQFLAFSTEVIDFTDRVDDPLAMLLEVEVGGGTHIAKGLRAARERLRVPSRSIVLTVSDFEEGWPVSGLLAEVRALVDTGATALGLAALNDKGKPSYNNGIAGQVVSCGMPVAAPPAKWFPAACPSPRSARRNWPVGSVSKFASRRAILFELVHADRPWVVPDDGSQCRVDLH